MARGIILFGPAGSGKTTLGRLVAEALGFPLFELDRYVWRQDTERPFTVMYSTQEKASRLMADISRGRHFVMEGSMSSFHAPFDPLFDLAVYLLADTQIRMVRIQQQAKARFGDRVLPGGDLYEGHQKFLDAAARYDTDGSPNQRAHQMWAESLPCPVLQLRGEDSPAENLKQVLHAYEKVVREPRCGDHMEGPRWS